MGAGADPVVQGFLKHPIQRILAPSHDEVGQHGVLPVSVLPQDDTPARIAVAFQLLLQIDDCHFIPSFQQVLGACLEFLPV